MKKIIILIFTLFFLCSCETKEEKNIDEYYFTYNAIDLKPGIIFNNVSVSLEEYNNTYSESSNYNESSANIYEYDDFEIETYYDETGIEKIYSIRLTNQEQKTNEGIKIGDTIDNMLKTYGDNYEKIDDNTYLYNISKTNITFTINDNLITDIVYYLI